MLLGIDVGTTGTKSIVFDLQGQPLAEAYCGYGLINGSDGTVEQRAEDWWGAVVQTVRYVAEKVGDPDEIAALSLSCQGGALVVTDRLGNPLRNAISWLDHRPTDWQIRELKAGKPENYHYLTTGWPLKNCYLLAEIRWLMENEPDTVEKAAYYLTTQDYLNLKLTGRCVLDYTGAGITNLENLKEKRWDPVCLKDLGIQEPQLAHLAPAGEIVGTLTRQAAKELGLTEKTLVVNGAMDQYCGALAAGVTESGDVMLASGTAWVVLASSSEMRFDETSFFAPCHHIVPGKFGAMATVPAGGVGMEWFRGTFQAPGDPPESFREIDRQGEKIGPGADGVLFYPHFSGATCPHWSENSRASFLGINLGHGRYHMARAIMEGVALEANEILKALRKSGVPTQRIRLIGGAAKSELWKQIIADVTELPVSTAKLANSACLGAAMIAGVGAGAFADYEEAGRKMAGKASVVMPRKENRACYRQIEKQYCLGFQALRDFYIAINR